MGWLGEMWALLSKRGVRKLDGLGCWMEDVLGW
jgi:hypothetical protein